jgi:hypothetical protein
MTDITSLQNSRIKHIVKLREDKKTRNEDGLMLVEGIRRDSTRPRGWTHPADGSLRP